MHFLSLIDTWNQNHSPELGRILRRLTAWANQTEVVMDAYLYGQILIAARTRTIFAHLTIPVGQPFIEPGWRSSLPEAVIDGQVLDAEAASSPCAGGHIQECDRLLRLEMIGLIQSASVHQRIAHTVQLLTADLRHRLAAIQNLCAVLAAFDRQREASRSLTKAVNLMIRATNSPHHTVPIGSLDLDLRPGVAMVQAACHGFEKSKKLIVSELICFDRHIDRQMQAGHRLKTASLRVPELTEAVHRWVGGSVEPVLQETLTAAKSLQAGLALIPRPGCARAANALNL